MDSLAVLSLGTPILATPPPGAERADVQGASFLRHLEQQLGRDRREELLGLSPGRDPRSLADARATEDPAAVLARFLFLLRGLAADNQPVAGGEWRLPGVGRSAVVQLAQEAGLGGDRLPGLDDLLASDQGVELDALLAFFQRRFSEAALERTRPVTVEESGLPLLQSILSRLGVDASEVARIGEVSVTGDDRLDLGRLLAALHDLTPQLAGGEAELSAFERRELLRLFERAGLSSPSLARSLAVGQEQDLRIGFERFVAMLQQGHDELAAQRPAVDPMGFIARLETMLADAGFAERRPAWTPLLQNSLQAVYRELAGMVDLATVTIRQGEGGAVPWGLEAGDGWPPLFAASGADAAGRDGETGPAASGILSRIRQLGQNSGDLPEGGIGTGDPASSHGQPLIASSHGQSLAAAGETAPAGRAGHLPASRLEESVLQQLHQGVLQGISQRRQHMVLKLHPPELGEVKVDVVVRHDQVAVSFAMENHRVKEILENNMQQFRDSLEQRGFTLGQCYVSVGQGDAGTGGERWREMLSSLAPPPPGSGADGRRGSVSSLLEQPVLSRWLAGTGRGVSISLVV